MNPKMTKVTVATPGTPVQLPAARAKSLLIVAWKGNQAASYGYLGLSGLNKTNGDNVITPIASVDGSFSIEGIDAMGNKIRVDDYFIDADVAGSVFLVTYWVG